MEVKDPELPQSQIDGKTRNTVVRQIQDLQTDHFGKDGRIQSGYLALGEVQVEDVLEGGAAGEIQYHPLHQWTTGPCLGRGWLSHCSSPSKDKQND